jgi:hypothetical protein
MSDKQEKKSSKPKVSRKMLDMTSAEALEHANHTAVIAKLAPNLMRRAVNFSEYYWITRSSSLTDLSFEQWFIRCLPLLKCGRGAITKMALAKLFSTHNYTIQKPLLVAPPVPAVPAFEPEPKPKRKYEVLDLSSDSEEEDEMLKAAIAASLGVKQEPGVKIE